jgi:hypothetical protein
MMLKRLAIILGLWLALAGAAQAQQNQPLFATGALTPGHALVLQQAGTPGSAVTRDAGPAIAGNFTELGITNDGLPLCVRDKAGLHLLCFGANALGGGLISYNPVGSGTPLPLTFNVNGTVIPFPSGPGNGNVVACTGTADDALLAQISAATVNSGGFTVASRCQVTTNLALAAPVTVTPGGSVAVAAGLALTLNGAVYANETQLIFPGPGTVVAAASPTVSVSWWGAGVAGADAAIGMRAALGSNRTIVVPPGNYALKTVQAARAGGGQVITGSSQTDANCSTTPCHSVPYAYLAAPGVYIGNLVNFTLDMRGAIFQMADGVAFSSVLMFDGDSNFNVLGGTMTGNRTGLSATQENAAIAVTSGVNFSFQDQTCGGNWGGVSACFVGDWWVAGSISNLYAPQSGLCSDLAFLHGVTINNAHCVGADVNGGSGPGYGGFSIIFDPPAAGDNHTGVAFTDTDGVTISNSSVSNSGWGTIIASGTNYHVTGNVFENNPGFGANQGVGVLIINSATGHPISSVTVTGNKFNNNGTAATHGQGIDLQTGADTISNITIAANIFNNNVVTAVDTNGPAALSNIIMQDNTCLGTNQTVCISTAFSMGIPVPFSSNYVAVSAIAGINSFRGNLEVGRILGPLPPVLLNTLGAGYVSAPASVVSSNEPEFVMQITGEPADGKLWFMDVLGPTLRGYAANDALNTFNTWLNVTRAGAVITDLTLATSSTMHFQGTTPTPGGKQPLCIDTTTNQIYHGTAGTC